MKERQEKSKGIFWRSFISLVGIALISIAMGNLMLFFFGDSTSAAVTTRRYGGVVSSRPVSQRYAWSVDYTFKDKAGITYSGHTTRRGNDISVKVEKTVYYFPFAPFINSLESEAEPNWGQPLYVGLGIFLIYVMNKK